MTGTPERNPTLRNDRDMRTVLASLALLAATGCSHAGTAAAPVAIDPCDGRCGTAAAQPQREEMLEALVEDSERGFELPEFSCPHDPKDVPALKIVDDSAIPAFEPERTRDTNMYSGEERLSDGTLFRHIERATEQVFACLDVAACYSEGDVAGGDIEFSLEVEPTGKVRGVDVQTTTELARLGVAACAREAIYKTEFPAYDGGGTWVSFTLEIE